VEFSNLYRFDRRCGRIRFLLTGVCAGVGATLLWVGYMYLSMDWDLNLFKRTGLLLLIWLPVAYCAVVSLVQRLHDAEIHESFAMPVIFTLPCFAYLSNFSLWIVSCLLPFMYLIKTVESFDSPTLVSPTRVICITLVLAVCAVVECYMFGLGIFLVFKPGVKRSNRYGPPVGKHNYAAVDGNMHQVSFAATPGAGRPQNEVPQMVRTGVIDKTPPFLMKAPIQDLSHSPIPPNNIVVDFPDKVSGHNAVPDTAKRIGSASLWRKDPSDLFDTDPLTSAEQLAGWLVAIHGPCYGKDYRLKVGRNYIGYEDEDSGMCVDIPISKEKEEAPGYSLAPVTLLIDPKSNDVFITPGDFHVSVNDQPLNQSCAIQGYDRIKIGSTILLFVKFLGVYENNLSNK
jgi:uncharacterized membrane protein YhaH (DUF805 family)